MILKRQQQQPADLIAVDIQTVLDYLADIIRLTAPDDVLDAVSCVENSST